MAAMRIGANYVPSTGWWYSWVDWDRAQVDADLVAIKALGADHIRIHCLWPLFQPNASVVSATMLRHLSELMGSAHDAGLDVIVTVMNGWLSGFDFRPTWLGARDNLFTDPAAIAAQQLLLTRIIGSVGDHPAFLGIDIGNEPNVLSTPTVNPTTGDDGAQWSREMLNLCDQLAPGKLHSVGVDHNPWLTDETTFDRFVLGQLGSASAVHSWSFFTGALDRYGDAGTGTIHLAEYMLELARAFSADPGRPVWLQEIGVAHTWLNTIDAPTFVARTLGTLTTVPNLWGVTWWCSHDISRSLDGFADLEYDLGLLTIDNTIKPMGEAFAEFARGAALASSPPPRSTALLLPTGVTPGLEFADQFFDLVERGVKPTIVAEQFATAEHLAARGITDVIGGEAHPESRADRTLTSL